MNGVWFALGLTMLAGMATGIGSAVAFLARRTNYRFLSVATGFSAGVMLYVSFVEILFKGARMLTEQFGERAGHWFNTLSFFGGMLLIGLIDNLIPSAENPHETHSEQETAPLHDASAPLPDFGGVSVAALESGSSNRGRGHGRLMRMGLFTALAIAIHNFPEGLVTFLTALRDPGVGGAIAFAIALHNIPEGISVAVPIFYATGKRSRAFVYSLLSGLAEPIGALIAYGLLFAIIGGQTGPALDRITGVMFGGVAGVMVYISLDELLPTSRAYGKGHDSLIGLAAGMAVMALSLLLMR